MDDSFGAEIRHAALDAAARARQTCDESQRLRQQGQARRERGQAARVAVKTTGSPQRHA